MEKIDKFIAAACYLPFISIIAIIAGLIKKASNAFVIYHVRNGIALFLLSFISIFSFAVPVIGGFIWLIFLAVDAYGIYLSIKGLTNFIPIVTPLGKIIPVEKIYAVLTGKPFPQQTILQSSSQNTQSSQQIIQSQQQNTQSPQQTPQSADTAQQEQSTQNQSSNK